MINVQRNELLDILYLVKNAKSNKDIESNIESVLCDFELDVKEQLKDNEYQKSKLLETQKVIEYVREEINKGEK